MPTVVSSIVIDRPIQDVFDVLTNVELLGRWFPADVEEHWTSPPPHGVGSTRHAVITMLGRRSENDAVATVYEPPHRATMSGIGPDAPFVTTVECEPAESGTRVAVTTELRFQTVGQRMVGPLFANWYRRSWDRGLVELRRQMEAGTL